MGVGSIGADRGVISFASVDGLEEEEEGVRANHKRPAASRTPLRDRVLVLHRGRLQLQLGRVPAVLAHVLGRCWLVDV
jgi:hypothetical protein